MLTRLALALNAWSERWIPSAFVIAGLLTALTFVLAVGLAGQAPADCLRHWGGGFWVLLEFGMQMCLIMMTGAILADSPLVRRALDALASVPRTPRGAVAWTAFLSMALCWLHWGLGMIAGAFLVRRVVARQPKTDYKLLVAVAYFGMGAVWHAGLSASAPLLVATPKHFMEAKVGIIPLRDTVFSSFNLALVATMTVVLVALAWLLYPRRREDAFILPPERLAVLEEPPPAEDSRKLSPFLRFLERGYAVNGMLGLMALAWLWQDAWGSGFNITFNKLNLFFLGLGLLLHPHPAAFGAAAEQAASYLHGIVIQFPFYAGMYGIIKGAGLDQLLGNWFVSLAGPKTFPLVVYWYSGILNYFIPSGGSKWAVEAPYVLEAARTLGVSPAKTVLAYAWGDMVTDMIQPFFCLPLLAIAKLEFKDILGYEIITFTVCGAIGTAAFLFF